MVTQLNREDFLENYWNYRPGEHVSFIEPTQQGKTYLMWQLVDKSMDAHPDLRFVSLMPKPKDPATDMWAKKLELKTLDSWPPRKPFFGKEPRGYVLWPRHIITDEDANRQNLSAVFKRCMNDQYREGASVTIADDAYLHAVLYDLNSELERHWTAGAGGGAGLWSAQQKPSGTLGGGSISSFVYNAPTHLFLGKDRDTRNIQRFSEIGGVDPKDVQHIVSNELKMHSINGHTVSDKLYIDKRGPYLCIVGP